LQKNKKKIPSDLPYPQRLTMLKDIVKQLPPQKFTLPPYIEDPEEMKRVWEQMRAGKYPLTSEGMVFWPKEGGKPVKSKFTEDADVIVKGVFPGTGRLKGKSAGGFTYALPSDPNTIVGRVGSGIDDTTRRWLWEHRDDPELIGRRARIKAQQQYPGGAYRAPRLIALHEDYPAKEAAFSEEDAENIVKEVLYHASPKKLDVLEPRIEHGDPDLVGENAAAIFATPMLQMALAYLGNKWSDRDIGQGGWGQSTKDRSIYLTEMRPNAFKEIFEGAGPGYLYTLPAEPFKPLPRQGSYDWERIADKPVKPIKVEEIKNILERLKEHPHIEMHPFDVKGDAFNKSLRFSVKRMKKMTPEKRKSYYEWRIKDLPKVVTDAFHAEMKRQGVDIPEETAE